MKKKKRGTTVKIPTGFQRFPSEMLRTGRRGRGYKEWILGDPVRFLMDFGNECDPLGTDLN